MGIPGGTAAARLILGACLCAVALAGGSAASLQAGQSPALSDGVYTVDQARRGQALYGAQCVSCHGEKLEGVVGPMLAGNEFTSAWGGRSLAELVDKIQNTMPQQAPGSLSRPQSIEITAYILQAGNFKSGQSALADTALKLVSFPAARPVAAAGNGGIAPVASANLAQFMRGVTFPNANILFNVQVKDPGQDKPRPPVPFDYTQWGNTVYYGWQAVDQAALALIESTPLFMVPGRRCENGRTVPTNKADFQRYTQELIDLSREFYRVSQSRKMEAVAEMAEKLDTACANCHKVYRDVGTKEGGGLGTDRCKP